MFKKRRREEELFDLLEEGVVRVDGRLRITHANRFACRVLEREKGELIKKRMDRLFHPLLECGAQLLNRARCEKTAVKGSFERRGPFELEASFGSCKRGVLLIRDRSDQRQAVEMGKAFVANASHELKTPITVIKGFAETLQDLPEISREMLSQITQKIVQNAERMEKLVRGLLILAGLERRSSLQLERRKLSQLVENCRHMLFPLFPDAEVVLRSPEIGVSLSCDADLLELALFNLLENAARYSSLPARIEVEIESQEEGVLLRVSDRGAGIAADDLKRIFERFYTADKARSRAFGGAGLGLSIVKTIVEKHEGKIFVESEINKGTRFTLHFPLL